MTTTNIQKHLSRLRNYLPAISLLVAIAWGGSGCSKDEATPEKPKESVFMNINTRALNSGDEQINTVRILLVSKNTAQTIDFNVFVDNPSNPLVIEAIAGSYDVYVVANETPGTTELPALKTVKTLGELKTLTLPSPADRTFTNIPMLGEVLNVMITAPAGVSSTTNLANVKIGGVDKDTKLQVDLTRLLCKLNLTIHYLADSIIAVTLENLPDKLPFWENNYFTPISRPSITVADLINKDNTNSTYPKTLYKENILLPSWVFADPTNIDEAVQLKVTTTKVEDKDKVPPVIYEIYKNAIGHAIVELSSPKDYTLKRNCDYSLTALIQNNMLIITGLVESWKTEDLEIEDDNPVVPPVVPAP